MASTHPPNCRKTSPFPASTAAVRQRKIPPNKFCHAKWSPTRMLVRNLPRQPGPGSADGTGPCFWVCFPKGRSRRLDQAKEPMTRTTRSKQSNGITNFPVCNIYMLIHFCYFGYWWFAFYTKNVNSTEGLGRFEYHLILIRSKIGKWLFISYMTIHMGCYFSCSVPFLFFLIGSVSLRLIGFEFQANLGVFSNLKTPK